MVDVLLEIHWALSQEHIHDVWGLTKLKHLTSLSWSGEVELGSRLVL